MKRQVGMHSRSRCKRVHEAKRKGRHQGTGMRRERVLRRLLKKYREAKKITKDIYHYFYLHAKGNIYKNKAVLVEAIHKMKQEKIRENQLAEQQEARRVKAAAKKQQRNHRKQVTMGIIEDKKEAAQAKN